MILRNGLGTPDSLYDGNGGTGPATPAQSPGHTALVRNAHQSLSGIGHTPKTHHKSGKGGRFDRLNNNTVNAKALTQTHWKKNIGYSRQDAFCESM